MVRLAGLEPTTSASAGLRSDPTELQALYKVITAYILKYIDNIRLSYLRTPLFIGVPYITELQARLSAEGGI